VLPSNCLLRLLISCFLTLRPSSYSLVMRLYSAIWAYSSSISLVLSLSCRFRAAISMEESLMLSDGLFEYLISNYLIRFSSSNYKILSLKFLMVPSFLFRSDSKRFIFSWRVVTKASFSLPCIFSLSINYWTLLEKILVSVSWVSSLTLISCLSLLISASFSAETALWVAAFEFLISVILLRLSMIFSFSSIWLWQLLISVVLLVTYVSYMEIRSSVLFT